MIINPQIALEPDELRDDNGRSVHAHFDVTQAFIDGGQQFDRKHQCLHRKSLLPRHFDQTAISSAVAVPRRRITINAPAPNTRPAGMSSWP